MLRRFGFVSQLLAIISVILIATSVPVRSGIQANNALCVTLFGGGCDGAIGCAVTSDLGEQCMKCRPMQGVSLDYCIYNLGTCCTFDPTPWVDCGFGTYGTCQNVGGDFVCQTTSTNYEGDCLKKNCEFGNNACGGGGGTPGL